MLKIEKGENNKFLRTICEKITENDFSEAVKIGKKMIDFLENSDVGVGIAAPQIGITKRIIAVKLIEKRGEKRGEKSKDAIMIINPEILEYSSETEAGEEGCLSLDDRYLVERSISLKLKYLNENGEIIEKDFSGFSAKIIQHEVDHLNGKMICDNFVEKIESK